MMLKIEANPEITLCRIQDGSAWAMLNPETNSIIAVVSDADILDWLNDYLDQAKALLEPKEDES